MHHSHPKGTRWIKNFFIWITAFFWQFLAIYLNFWGCKSQTNHKFGFSALRCVTLGRSSQVNKPLFVWVPVLSFNHLNKICFKFLLCFSLLLSLPMIFLRKIVITDFYFLNFMYSVIVWKVTTLKMKLKLSTSVIFILMVVNFTTTQENSNSTTVLLGIDCYHDQNCTFQNSYCDKEFYRCRCKDNYYPANNQSICVQYALSNKD